MPEYDIMYKRLFNAITQCIEILQKAQLEAEELYIKAEPTALILLNTVKMINEDSAL